MIVLTKEQIEFVQTLSSMITKDDVKYCYIPFIIKLTGDQIELLDRDDLPDGIKDQFIKFGVNFPLQPTSINEQVLLRHVQEGMTELGVKAKMYNEIQVGDKCLFDLGSGPKVFTVVSVYEETLDIRRDSSKENVMTPAIPILISQFKRFEEPRIGDECYQMLEGTKVKCKVIAVQKDSFHVAVLGLGIGMYDIPFEKFNKIS